MNKLPPLLPYLVVSAGTAAIEFYKKAFGAVEDEEPHFVPGSSKVLNARMSIHGGVFMLCDDFSSTTGGKEMTPLALGGTSVMLHIQLDEGVDEAFERAIAAGATVEMPLMDQFWGDRYGQLTDPFGHRWTMGQKIADPTRDQVDEATKAAFEKTT